jgi:quercetin dioxygenase-like cupin family protein
MDITRFEARLRTEGYPEIRTNEMPPNCHNAEHSHPFDVLALVLEGDEFSMKAGYRHIEDAS